MRTRTICPISILLIICYCTAAFAGDHNDSVGAEDEKVFRAGAAQVEITPRELPVIVSGYFF